MLLNSSLSTRNVRGWITFLCIRLFFMFASLFFDKNFQPNSQLLPRELNSLNEEVDVLCGRDGGVETNNGRKKFGRSPCGW